MLFRELPLLERPAAARHAGYEAVESWWPPAESAEAFAQALERESYAPVCLNSFGGEIERGERGFLNVRARHDRNVEEVAEAIAYARRLGTPALNVLVGLALPDESAGAQLDTVAAILRELALEAGRAGIILLVEPINTRDVPRSLLPTPAAAGALVEAVGSPHVRLLYDAYHAA